MEEFKTLKELKKTIVKTATDGAYQIGDYKFRVGNFSNLKTIKGSYNLVFSNAADMKKFKDVLLKLDDVLKVIYDAEKIDVYYRNGVKALTLTLY